MPLPLETSRDSPVIQSASLLAEFHAIDSDATLTGTREPGRVMGEGGRIISISSGVSTRTGVLGRPCG